VGSSLAHKNEHAIRYLIEQIVCQNDPNKRKGLLGELDGLLKTELKPEVARLIQRVQWTFARNNAKPKEKK